MKPALVQAGLAAVLGLASLSAAPQASAQPYYGDYTQYRCDADGDCAYYRCDRDGDYCRRVSAYTHRRYYNSYSTRQYRCVGDRCAYYQCDRDGDDCRRVSGWTYRYDYERRWRY
jgi:hypothetical protein